MKRRTFLKIGGLGLSALALLNAKTFAAMANNPAYNIKMLTDKVGVFTEKGGTILFMFTSEGPVVIDAQFPDSARHLIDEIKIKTAKPFRLLINTHHHADHTAGNIAFKGLVPHVLAHANSKINQENLAAKQHTEVNQLYPDQLFNNIHDEKIGEETFSLHYFGPGHTNGDSIILLKEANIIHMGDLVFNRRHPYIDRSAGASITNWIKILDQTTEMFDNSSSFVCGHAGEGYDIVLTRADLLAFRDYLRNLLSYVDQQLRAGKNKEDILTAGIIPGSPEWKGEGIDRPLTAAYEELMALK